MDSTTGEVQTRNPLHGMVITPKQKKRLARVVGGSRPLGASVSEEPPPPDFSIAPRHFSRRVVSERGRAAFERCLEPGGSAPSSPGGAPYPPSASSAQSANFLPTPNGGRLNKASSWMNRLAGANEQRRGSTDSSPVSPRPAGGFDIPRVELTSGSGVFLSTGQSGGSTTAGTLNHSAPTSPTQTAHSVFVSPLAGAKPLSPRSWEQAWSRAASGHEGFERGSDEEEEKRKKRFFNNLIFFKDVESVRGSSLMATVPIDPTAGGSDMFSRKDSKKNALDSSLGGGTDSSGLDVRVNKTLRKVPSGRQVTDSILKATRNLGSSTGSHIVGGRKKARSDIIEDMMNAERTYLARLNMLARVKWFFGRFMLAIYDEVHLRPSLEQILGQFEYYARLHADFLAALIEKLRQSHWDNSLTPIGDLLIDKMGFLQCYCDFYSESTRQWQKIEEASRISFGFGVFLQEMERKPELESHSIKSLFTYPTKHLAGYVTLLKEMMEVTSIHHPDYACTRKAYFQAKVIVGSMQKESLLLP